MEALIYLVIVVVIAVVAIRIGMIVAPAVGRLAPDDDDAHDDDPPPSEDPG